MLTNQLLLLLPSLLKYILLSYKLELMCVMKKQIKHGRNQQFINCLKDHTRLQKLNDKYSRTSYLLFLNIYLQKT